MTKYTISDLVSVIFIYLFFLVFQGLVSKTGKKPETGLD